MNFFSAHVRKQFDQRSRHCGIYIQEKRKVSDFLCVLSYVCLHKMKPCEKERDQLKKILLIFRQLIHELTVMLQIYLGCLIYICEKCGQHTLPALFMSTTKVSTHPITNYVTLHIVTDESLTANFIDAVV